MHPIMKNAYLKGSSLSLADPKARYIVISELPSEKIGPLRD